MIVNFAVFGTTLGTRKLGSEIRSQVEHSIKSNDKAIFDFSDVSLISNSFADECFGKLVEEFGMEVMRSKTSFTNTNSKVSLVVKKAIVDRLNKACCV